VLQGREAPDLAKPSVMHVRNGPSRRSQVYAELQRAVDEEGPRLNGRGLHAREPGELCAR